MSNFFQKSPKKIQKSDQIVLYDGMCWRKKEKVNVRVEVKVSCDRMFQVDEN